MTSNPPLPEQPILLRSSRLKVEVAAPGSIYQLFRFDWTGFITQVTLDEGAQAHTFCVPESYRPDLGTGGIGLCNEFGIDAPIGFAEAGPDDLFPKLGIGLLKRGTRPEYAFHLPYELVTRFPIRTESSPDQVGFVVEPVECRGYAARLTKTLSVRENWLDIDYRLENTGTRPIVTNEYVHNFVGFDQQPMGPEYRMRFPFPTRLEMNPNAPRQLTEILEIQGQELGLRSRPESSFYCRLLELHKTSEPQWALRLEPARLEMSETDDFTPSRVAVWGAAHVISAEVFVEINLQPGETQSWKRRYEFKGK